MMADGIVELSQVVRRSSPIGLGFTYDRKIACTRFNHYV